MTQVLIDPADEAQFVRPSKKSILIGSAVSLVVGAAMVVTFVMPAEYGIDPTGVGTATSMTCSKPAPVPVSSTTLCASPSTQG